MKVCIAAILLSVIMWATITSRVKVEAKRRKELQVIKDIRFPPYQPRETRIFDKIVEIIGQTTEDNTNHWLKFGNSCDPEVHRSKLSTSHKLSNLFEKTFTENLCSIFEDMVCDTVEKVCKCWTAGGIGRMEWQPAYENPRKPAGKCVMTARQRCGYLELPPGLYPHVDFPILRKIPCDSILRFSCVTDLDGVKRCSDGDEVNTDHDSFATRPFCPCSSQLYFTIFFFVPFYYVQ